MFKFFKKKNITEEKIKSIIQAMSMMTMSDDEIDPLELEFISEAGDRIRKHFNYHKEIDLKNDERFDHASLLDNEDKTLLLQLLVDLMVADGKLDYNEIILFRMFIGRVGGDIDDYEELIQALFEHFNVNPQVYEEWEELAVKKGAEAASEAIKGKQRYLITNDDQKCVKCSKVVDSDSKFCAFCGTKLN